MNESYFTIKRDKLIRNIIKMIRIKNINKTEESISMHAIELIYNNVHAFLVTMKYLSNIEFSCPL